MKILKLFVLFSLLTAIFSGAISDLNKAIEIKTINLHQQPCET